MIGYPSGGPLRIVPAVVERRLTARGRDIYSRGVVLREGWFLTARVRSGNSGGPVVDGDGRFVGVVFAASVSSQGQAFALTTDEAMLVIDRAATAQTPVDTRRLLCVR